MRVVRVHPYGVRASSCGERRLVLRAPGKALLEASGTTGVDEEIWEPAELVLGALSACFEETLLEIARRRGVPIHAVTTDATARVVSKDGDRRCVGFELDVAIETDAGFENELEDAALLALERSPVARALAAPVRLTRTVDARAAEPEPPRVERPAR